MTARRDIGRTHVQIVTASTLLTGVGIREALNQRPKCQRTDLRSLCLQKPETPGKFHSARNVHNHGERDNDPKQRSHLSSSGVDTKHQLQCLFSRAGAERNTLMRNPQIFGC